MVCLSLSAGTAYASELEQQQIDVPDIKTGQEFYINSQGKIIIGTPQEDQAQTEAVQEAATDEEYDDEYMLAIFRPRMQLTVDGKIIMDNYDGTPAELPEPMVIYQPTDSENEKANTVATESDTKDGINVVAPVASYPVEDSTGKQDFVEQETQEKKLLAEHTVEQNVSESAEPLKDVLPVNHVNGAVQEEIPVITALSPQLQINNVSVEKDNAERAAVSDRAKVKNSVMQKIVTTGEMKRNAAEEEMSKLLDKSISRGGVELMVTMLNRNQEMSHIDKLNCYIGYCRAVSNKELPNDVKSSLLQLITDKFE